MGARPALPFWPPNTRFNRIQQNYGAAMTVAVPSPLPTTINLPSGE